MQQLTRNRRLILGTTILALLCFILVAGVGLSSTDEKVKQTSNILVVLLGLILGLLQVIPSLTELLRPAKKLSDQQIQNAFAELGSAKAYFDNNQYQQAIDKLDNVIRVLPKKADAYQLRARANVELGNVASGLKDYAQAIELEPGFPFNYSGRGSLYKEMGELELAIPDFLKTLALAPELSGMLFQLGHAYFLLGNFEEAIKCLTKVLNHPKTSENEKEAASEHIDRARNMLALATPRASNGINQ